MLQRDLSEWVYTPNETHVWAPFSRRRQVMSAESRKRAPGVKSVTGLGLMIGIETEAPAAAVVNRCIEKGVLCLTAKTKVRLLPALNIPKDVLAQAVGAIKEAAAELAESKIES